MRKVVLALAILLLSQAAAAQTVSCTVSGLNAKQTALLSDFLAAVNAERAAQNPPQAPFATFNAYCSDLVFGAVLDYVRQQGKVNAEKVAAASEANGDEVAPNAQCSAAGLPNGCTKNQVACFVLSGNTNCS